MVFSTSLDLCTFLRQSSPSESSHEATRMIAGFTNSSLLAMKSLSITTDNDDRAKLHNILREKTFEVGMLCRNLLCNEASTFYSYPLFLVSLVWEFSDHDCGEFSYFDFVKSLQV